MQEVLKNQLNLSMRSNEMNPPSSHVFCLSIDFRPTKVSNDDFSKCDPAEISICFVRVIPKSLCRVLVHIPVPVKWLYHDLHNLLAPLISTARCYEEHDQPS